MSIVNCALLAAGTCVFGMYVGFRIALWLLTAPLEPPKDYHTDYNPYQL